MTPEERNRIIAEQLNEGHSLSEIQKLLAEEYDVNITYLDLRMIASELSVDWSKQEDVPHAGHDTSGNGTVLGEQQQAPPARTKVTVSKVARPDAAVSGTVEFASGAKGQWFVDHMGRLAVSPEEGSSKPTEEDIQEFQEELQNTLRGQ